MLRGTRHLEFHFEVSSYWLAFDFTGWRRPIDGVHTQGRSTPRIVDAPKIVRPSLQPEWPYPRIEVSELHGTNHLSLKRNSREVSMATGSVEVGSADPLPNSEGASNILNGRYLPPPKDRDGKLWVRTSAIIQASPVKLYQAWRSLESIPLWQAEIISVTATSETTSHWLMKSGDDTIAWDSEILADEPGKRIAWRSIGGESNNAGEVIFESTPGGRGTMVTVLQEFRMGKLASARKTFVGRNPKQAVIENLRHFKALIETGEIPRTTGQASGPRGTVGKMKQSLYGETVETPPRD